MDEDVFGLEVDLDNYSIVAVGDFNMARWRTRDSTSSIPSTCSRARHCDRPDYVSIDRVIAHEYFHNWTGNRSPAAIGSALSQGGAHGIPRPGIRADTYSRPVERIREVRGLRSGQFAEDADRCTPGAARLLHRDQQFYTSTVYEKAPSGADDRVLIGARAFRGHGPLFRAPRRAGGDLRRLRTGDGRRFGHDFSQFKRWYDQAARPRSISNPLTNCRQPLHAQGAQSCPPTPGQEKSSLHIPLAIGLVGPTAATPPEGTRVLSLRMPEESFAFDNIAPDRDARPVPSLARDFRRP